MTPRRSFQSKDVIRFMRPLLSWMMVICTLFVAAVSLRQLSIRMEVWSLTECHGSSNRMKSALHNSSCQQLSHPPVLSDKLLGIVSNVYVISLPRRTDRRIQMDLLKDVLHLDWIYIDACEADASAVTTILRQVHVLRSQLMSRPTPEVGVGVPVFDWPHDMEDMVYSQEELRPFGADLWTLPSSHSLSDLAVHAQTADPYAPTHAPSDKALVVSDPPPLACTSGNDVFAAYSPNLPLYRHLTAAKVACWYSHLQTIRDIANGKHGASLILEDDVDIERDVEGRLRALWDALPSDWDIVYLGTFMVPKPRQKPTSSMIGHCWSNESQFPPLRRIYLQLPSGRFARSALHPSSAPKCTHAYVLSRIGARRVAAHLRHPPFAYSRAIDQALAWLVQSGRLRAFSIVPPVVMQRKIAGSDVMPGLGSAWRDELYDGVFGGPSLLAK
jgi:GR25 family glycosyltransferase involved in LPS biosynthesis